AHVLKSHVLTHINRRDFPCTIEGCEYKFKTKGSLKRHLRRHTGERPYECPKCHRRFTESGALTRHCKSRTSCLEKNDSDLPRYGALSLEELPIPGADRNGYKCPACERIFRGSTYLKQHMRSHAGVKPHKCSLCEKCFITKDALTKHSAVHTEDRNYKCGECGKLFKRISHIREHLKVHSSDRPFSCEHCFKTFKTKNSRMVHLRTHNAVLPYQCRFCDRFFREKASLQRHIRMHTGERPYKCVHCGRGFSEQGTLQRHLKAKGRVIHLLSLFIPCTKNLYLTRKAELITEQLAEGKNQEEEPTVLAEFSSVVADTQYILPDGTEALDISVRFLYGLSV
ncbi:hypothetical protein LOTGIDRAFT_109963, partial [Lottia gigantea]